MSGAATEKARLPRFSLVLGLESCCEVDVQETSQIRWNHVLQECNT